MKTREQVLEIIKAGKESKCIDGRDYGRLVKFFPVENWKDLGFEPTGNGSSFEEKELTRKNVLYELKEDLSFAFDKALNKRGISASLMYDVIKMWMWVLDDEELYNFKEYAMYGLPLLKAVALRYGFDNRIGDDKGSEDKYDENYHDYDE